MFVMCPTNVCTYLGKGLKDFLMLVNTMLYFVSVLFVLPAAFPEFFFLNLAIFYILCTDIL